MNAIHYRTRKRTLPRVRNAEGNSSLAMVRCMLPTLLLLSLTSIEGFTLRYPKKVDIHRATYPSVIFSPHDFRDFLAERTCESRKRSKPLIASVIERATVLTHILGEEAFKDESSMNDETNGEIVVKLDPSKEDKNDDDERPTCRIVTYSDSKLPSPTIDVFPVSLFEAPYMLRRLDDIYHAVAHDESRLLSYMQCEKLGSAVEDEKLPEYTRTCLEDAGFSLLTKRDLDLCEALNAGYLLRLSVVPDVSGLDENLAREFYPERFDTEGKLRNHEELLFGGRVLVYRRGYSREITRGRLFLPKLDYLQASVVQRSASWVKRRLDEIEDSSTQALKKTYRSVAASVSQRLDALASQKSLPSFIIRRLQLSVPTSEERNGGNTPFFKLTRYGGSKKEFVTSEDPFDALAPFEECSFDSDTRTPIFSRASPSPASINNLIKESSLARPDFRCAYDVGTLGPNLTRPPMQVLERATISNLVNIFTRSGRRKLFRTLISKSEIVEPTYEEVVVIWRPLSDEEKKQPLVIRPPNIVYEIADMFDIEGALPPKPNSGKKGKMKMPLEIRNFEGVPMANVPAVLPKTKLVFRPADAFVFDFVSVLTFLLVIGSQRFDSPKLDLLAVVSVSLWLLRTVLRYSNKLARYNLLVKTFLTSKISHRNSGALKYLATEAGSQRASRAALVHEWLCRLSKSTAEPATLSRSQLVREGSCQVNDLLRKGDDREIPVNIDAALNDLEDLKLVTFSEDAPTEIVQDPIQVTKRLKRAWDNIFEGRMRLQDLMGRRHENRSSAESIGEFL
ncbi:hypothetical protein FisN_2Lh147 [Fistulifera solaris]|uniref:Uncharacterized protein n=1 Tax=Fistulifera solaris TaxID=1519565 RepID=A0A1Z5KF87_FISSO|nr:hypothetical protein FisN_2Lh147 [Fistulifera solaris]|eukprot:GAX24876.1 hypothetical protein FisN_2Lh147 [Fistulifera solaris]